MISSAYQHHLVPAHLALVDVDEAPHPDGHRSRRRGPALPRAATERTTRCQRERREPRSQLQHTDSRLGEEAEGIYAKQADPPGRRVGEGKHGALVRDAQGFRSLGGFTCTVGTVTSFFWV